METYKAADAVKDLRLLANFAKVLRPLQDICELASGLDSDIEQLQNQQKRLLDYNAKLKDEHEKTIDGMKEEIETWKSGLARTKAECVDGINTVTEELRIKQDYVNSEKERLNIEIHNYYAEIAGKRVEAMRELEDIKAEHASFVTKLRALREVVSYTVDLNDVEKMPNVTSDSAVTTG